MMVQCELFKELLSFGGEGNEDFAAIVLGAGPADKAACFEAIHQFDGAMVADFHAAGEFTDARTHPIRYAFNGQHKLVLDVVHAGRLHGLFTEMEEPADLMAKLGKRLIIGYGELLHRAWCCDPLAFASYRKTIQYESLN